MEVAMLRNMIQSHRFSALPTLLILCAPFAGQVVAQTPAAKPTGAAAEEKPAGSKLTTAQKIAIARSAGPAEISKNATIMDMTDMRDMKHLKQLRAGTNGWVCYASTEEPMCLDKPWQKWFEAWTSKSALTIDGIGISYMLQGDKGGSNTDPYATGPTADNQWAVAPAHVMVLVPDPKMLDALPTDPKNGGAWVMWKGTPYAHIMVPVSPTKAVTVPSK